MPKLKFVDERVKKQKHPTIWIGPLTNYRQGLTPSYGQEIEVTENEAIKLLRKKNGNKPMFEKVSTRRERVVEEVDNG